MENSAYSSCVHCDLGLGYLLVPKLVRLGAAWDSGRGLELDELEGASQPRPFCESCAEHKYSLQVLGLTAGVNSEFLSASDSKESGVKDMKSLNKSSCAKFL